MGSSELSRRPGLGPLTRTCERVGAADERDNWQLARIMSSSSGRVPVLVPLFVTAELERPGRNVSLVGARIALENGSEVARARALRIRVADTELADSYVIEPPFSEPAAATVSVSCSPGDQVAYHRDSVDVRFADGS